MKKFLTFLMMILAINFCGMNANATTLVYTVYQDVNFVDEVTEKSFLDTPENLTYQEKTTEYTASGYIFTRFDNFLSVSRVDNEGKESCSQIISGSHFVATKSTIWYISDKREISSFEFSQFDFTSDDSFDNRESNLTTRYRNSDLSSFKANEIGSNFYKYDRYVDVVGPVAFTTDGNTVVFEDNYVSVYSENRTMANNIVDVEAFPFSFREIGFMDDDYYTGECTYSFVLESNTVGIITISPMGTIMYDVYDEGDAVRHLIADDEDDDVVFVMDNGYLLYTEDGHIKASNGEFHFFMQDMDIKQQLSGDTIGVGPGFSDCCILYSYDYDKMQEDGFDPEAAFEEVGIDL